MRLAAEDAAAGRPRLDPLDDLAIPVPHTELDLVAPEVRIVGVEVEGFVAGRPASLLAHPLHNRRFAALLDGELDLGLAGDENPPEAVTRFGPYD